MENDAHVDGNAVGGLLLELFGREMTEARGRCDGCGSVNAVGALIVYRSGPGDVIRCPGCMAVVMVATPLPDGVRWSFAGLRWLQVA